MSAVLPLPVPPAVPLVIPLTTLPDGTLRVAGTRVPLDTVILCHLAGESAEAIHAAFPTVSLADVYACLAYYHRRPAEVAAYLAGRAAEADALRRQVEADSDQAGFRARLLGRRAAGR